MSSSDTLPPLPPLPPTLARFRTYGNPNAKEDDRPAVYDALRGRLLFKSGSTFNDPFEGKPHYVPAHSDAQKQRYILGKYLRMIARQERIPSPNKWAEGQMRGKTPQQITERMIEISRKGDHESVKLLCLMHPDTIATTLPWSHYADSHRGVCIELDSALQPVLFALPITYSTEYPTLKVPRTAEHTNAGMEKAFLAKAIEWKYEQEFRVIRPLDAKAGISEHMFVTWDGQVAVARPEIAKRLTLGAKMAQPLRNELIDWTRANAPYVQIFQAELHPSRYEVTRTRVA